MAVESYTNDVLGIIIQYLPSNFYLNLESGDRKSGKLELKSMEIYDEIWGAYITFALSWISYPMEQFTDGDAIQEILNLFAKINMSISERINDYLNGHYLQMVIGDRMILKKGITYNIKEIHGVMYCEQSFREVSFKITINNVQNIYPSWKDTLFRIAKSVKCH